MTKKKPLPNKPSDTPPDTDIFQLMRAEREKVLDQEESLQRSLFETLYDNLKLPIGLACYGLGGMQNQLYAWSHDFASTGYVGVPVTNKFIGFTGAEWEYLNIFFAQGSAVALALLGGYFVGHALWAKAAEINRDTKKLAYIRERKDVGKKAKKEIDSYLSSKKRWLPDFENALKKKHPRLYRVNRFLKSRAGLPLTLTAHTAVLSAIHYTWSQRYYEGETYVGGFLHESVFWNWSWFLGAYTTYIALQLASFYFFNARAEKKPAKMVRKIKRKLERLNRKIESLRKKQRPRTDEKTNRKYIKFIDRLIKLEKELAFWKELE
ncbi:MAG: hypothetical protein KAU14_08940 [Thermoplasmata archaeon]|nr:hypothetical protein [Thermoplasmata archaeon]